MTRYEVHVGGRILYDLMEEDIGVLHETRRIRRDTPCRRKKDGSWRTVDELFPLLKHGNFGSPTVLATRSREILDASPTWRDAPEQAKSSAILAGWVCFGCGLAIAWFFPFGNAFFSIAIILAIVAMCTHQVGKGLVLLLSSFAGIGVSVLAFTILVAGTFGLALSAVSKGITLEPPKSVQMAPQTFPTSVPQ